MKGPPYPLPPFPLPPGLLLNVCEAAWLEKAALAAIDEDVIGSAFGLTIDATTAPGPGLLFRGVGLQSYDGDGHLTIRDHIVFDGTPETDSWTPGTGVYLVHPDCTGIATFSLPSEGPPLKVHFVVVEGGRKLREVIDENAIKVTGEKVDD